MLDRPLIKVEISIGLVNSTNRQALQEFQDELESAGYVTEVGIRPPSGQFAASLETINVYIVAGGSALVGLAVKDTYEGIKSLVRKLVKRKKSERDQSASISIPIGKNFAVGVIIESDDGKQNLNLLVKDVDNIKELSTRPDWPHGHIIEPSDDGGLNISRSDGSAEEHWTPPQ
jgi:hypothetical protein